MYYLAVPYNPYYPVIKYAKEGEPGFWSTAWQTSRPYLGAAGLGAGIGAVGGLGAALIRRKDWREALKSALIGAVLGGAGGVLARGVYGLHQRWKAPAKATAPAPAAAPAPVPAEVPPPAPMPVPLAAPVEAAVPEEVIVVHGMPDWTLPPRAAIDHYIAKLIDWAERRGRRFLEQFRPRQPEGPVAPPPGPVEVVPEQMSSPGYLLWGAPEPEQGYVVE